MAQNDQARRELYNMLKEDGYYNGDYSHFTQNIDNAQGRQQLFNMLKEDGYYNGSWDDFDNNLTIKGVPTDTIAKSGGNASVKPTLATQSMQANKSPMELMQEAREVTKKVANSQNGKVQSQVKGNNAVTKSPMELMQEAKEVTRKVATMRDPLNTQVTDKNWKEVAYNAGMPVGGSLGNMGRSEEELGTSISRKGGDKPVPKDSKVESPFEFEGDKRTLQQKVSDDVAIGGALQEGRSGMNRTMQVAERAKEINQNLSDEERLQRELDDVNAQIEAKLGQYGETQRLASYSVGYTASAGHDMEMDKLEARRSMLNDAMRTLKAGKETHKSGGFWDNIFSLTNWDNAKNNLYNLYRGAKDVVTDPKFYTMGYGDLNEGAQLLKIKNKVDNGEELSDSEASLALAAGLRQQMESEYGSDLPHMYNAAVTTVNMVPFMAQIAMNPAGGIGSAWARAAVRKFGKSGAKAIASRVGARIAGDAVSSVVLASTLQGASTAADAINRHVGDADISVSDSGNLQFNGFKNGMSGSEAVYKAMAAATIENFTEEMGDWGMWTTLGKKFGKTALGQAMKRGKDNMFHAMNMDNVNTLIFGTKTGDWSNAINAFKKRTKWSGNIGEMMEEEYGIILNSIFTGDNKLSDLADTEQQIDIALGVGLFGGFMSGVSTAAFARDFRKAKNGYKNADRVASFRLTADRWDDIKGRLDGLEGKELTAAINAEIADMHPVEAKAVVDYFHAKQVWNGFNTARELKKVENADNSAEEQVNNIAESAINAGENAESAEELHGIAVKNAQAAEKLGQTPEGQQKMETLQRYFEDGVTDVDNPQIAAIIDGDEAAKAYFESLGMQNGVENKVESQLQSAVDAERARIEPYVDEDGTYREITVDGKSYVVKSMTSDFEAGDYLFVYVDENGDPHEIYGSQIDKDEDNNPIITAIGFDEHMQQFEQENADRLYTETEDAMNYDQRTVRGDAFDMGAEFTMAGEGESGQQYKVVGYNEQSGEYDVAPMKAQMNEENGSVEYVPDLDNIIKGTREDFVEKQEEYYRPADSAGEPQNTTGDRPVEEVTESPLTEVENAELGETRTREEGLAMEGETAESPMEGTSTIAIDEDGEPVFDNASEDDIARYYSDNFERDDAAEFIQGSVDAANETLSAVNAEKPKDGKNAPKASDFVGKPNAFMRAKAEWKAQQDAAMAEWQKKQDAAQAEVDKWMSVRNKWQQEQVDKEMDAKSLELFNNDKATNEQKDNALGDSTSVDEFISREAYKYRYLWRDKGVKKGMASHLFGKDDAGERAKRLAYLSNKEGVSVEEAAHDIAQHLRESGLFGTEIDEIDVLNTLVDALRTHNNRGEVLNGIAERRAAALESAQGEPERRGQGEGTEGSAVFDGNEGESAAQTVEYEDVVADDLGRLDEHGMNKIAGETMDQERAKANEQDMAWSAVEDEVATGKLDNESASDGIIMEKEGVKEVDERRPSGEGEGTEPSGEAEGTGASGEDEGTVAGESAKKAADMSDEELLGKLNEDGWDESMYGNEYTDEYDSRHSDEYLAMFDQQMEFLEKEGVSMEDAEEMNSGLGTQFRRGGFASDERTALSAQMDALEEYIGTLKAANRSAEPTGTGAIGNSQGEPVNTTEKKAGTSKSNDAAVVEDRKSKFRRKPNTTKVAKSESKRLVSDDRMAQLAEELMARLGGLKKADNAGGIDGSTLSLGMELAVGVLERGATKFVDYASQMVGMLGDVVRPYLKAFYNGVRDMPQAIENGISDEMDSYEAVSKINVATFDKRNAQVDIVEAAVVMSDEKKVEKAVRKPKVKKAAESFMGDLFGDYAGEPQNTTSGEKADSAGEPQNTTSGEQAENAAKPQETTMVEAPMAEKDDVEGANAQREDMDSVNGVKRPSSLYAGGTELYYRHELEAATIRLSRYEKMIKDGENGKIAERGKKVAQEVIDYCNAWLKEYGEKGGEVEKASAAEPQETKAASEPQETKAASEPQETKAAGEEIRTKSQKSGEEIATETPKSAEGKAVEAGDAVDSADGYKVGDKVWLDGKKVEVAGINTDFGDKRLEIRVKTATMTTTRVVKPSEVSREPKVKDQSEIDRRISNGDRFVYTYTDSGKKQYSVQDAQTDMTINKEQYDYALAHGGKGMSAAEMKDRDDENEYQQLIKWYISQYPYKELDEVIDAIENTEETGARKEFVQRNLPKLKRYRELSLDSRKRLDRITSDGKAYEHKGANAQKDVAGNSAKTAKTADEKPTSKKEEHYGYEKGDKVMYKGEEATIFEFEMDGRPVLDTGMAPVIYDVVDWEDVHPIVRIPEESGKDVAEHKEEGGKNGNKGVTLQNASNTNINNQNVEGNDVRISTVGEGSGRQQSDENGTLGEGSAKGNARTDGRAVDRRDGSHNSNDGKGGSGLSRTSESAGNEHVANPRNTNNNHAERGTDYAPKSPAARFKANLAAIKLMKQLVRDGKQATAQQMEVLRKFSGWGGLGQFINNREEIGDILTDEEYDQAVMSINSAYYTPSAVIDAMWDIARKLGFKGGNVLEGSAGIGNIIGLMPMDMSERSNITAVEIDSTTGNILKLLYPDADVQIKGFEKTKVGNASVDLAITNVPFVTGLRVKDDSGDKDLSTKFHNIHDFCIAKNVRKLRPGGIGIFISSSGTLDKSTELRKWVTTQGDADFISAFRLNNETFGGAPVTSDIIIIRRRVNGQKSAYAEDLSSTDILRSAEYDTGEKKTVRDPKTGKRVEVNDVRNMALTFNSYFVEHPENMGGEMAFNFEKGVTRYPTSTGLFPVRGVSQMERLNAWAESIKEMDGAAEPTANMAEMEAVASMNEKLGEGVKEGSLILDSKGNPCVARMGVAVPLEGKTIGNKVKGRSKAECIKMYDAIKSALAEVLDYQAKNADDSGLEPLIKKLNAAYDKFTKVFGRLSKNTALSFLKNDVDFSSIAALEKVSETGDKEGNRIITIEKTDVFNKRVVGVVKEMQPKTVADAVVASIFKNGYIDTQYIADKLGMSEEVARKKVLADGHAFEDPLTGKVEVDYEYLSGNVRQKLADAHANNEDGRYNENIKALERVKPMDIPAHLIEFNLGSNWIEPKLFADFIKEMTGKDVKLMKVGGTWAMGEGNEGGEKNKSYGVYSSVFRKTIWGTSLIEAAMRNTTISVTETHKHSDGTTETIKDKDATTAANNKVNEIRAEFREWAKAKMQSDPELAARIERKYNDMFNNYVPKSIPKSYYREHLDGSNHAITLYPHQSAAVTRAVAEPLLLAHEVGTGKTFTLISTAMEMRRLGTAKKPMIVVQNATVGQFVKDAKLLYPNAKVLSIEDSDRTAEGRKNFYAKIKYNDWDMIVVPQSVFERIPDAPKRQVAFIEAKIAEKMAILEQMKEDKANAGSMVIRQAEKDVATAMDELLNINGQMIEANEKKKTKGDKKKEVAKQNAAVRAQEMLDRAVDDVENFDDMDVDAILVDEAHEYKHLGFATAMQRGVKGVDPKGSKKSQGVYLKCQAVKEKNNGRNVVFATGTPISNTAAEVWTFMKYLMPEQTMKDYGIFYFDDFVRNFGNISMMLEFTTSGSFKENNRFAGYVNTPELIRIWNMITDTVLTEEAGKVNEKIPELEGGKAQDIFLPQSKSLRAIMKSVRAELEAFEKMDGKEKAENSHIPLVMYGIASKAAIDPRLVWADAPDEPLSKTNRAVEETMATLEKTKDYKGTVAIFCDSYRNKQSGFNVYEEIKRKLVEKGVPAEQVFIMKSGMSVKKKQEIFDKVNAGEIRVILGSTQTLGTGVNIQERLNTLIHMDVPNRPMDYTQRNGRILRQGNLHKKWDMPVRVLRFGVEDSLDVTGYQRLKTKGAIADSIMKGKQMLVNNQENRSIEEEEDMFGDAVATLSGSEFAMLKNQAEREYKKYENKKKQWEADQVYIANTIRRCEGQIRTAEEKISEYEKQIAEIGKRVPMGEKSPIEMSGKKYVSVAAMDDVFKEINKKQNERSNELKKQAEGGLNGKAKITNVVRVGELEFVFTTMLSADNRFDGGRFVATVHRETTYTCDDIDLVDVPVSGGYVKNGVEDIMENVVTGADAKMRIERDKRSIEENKTLLDTVRKREGKPFEFDKELEEAKQKVEEYSELMQDELAKKEAKYAEDDVEGVDLKAMDSEEDDEENGSEGDEVRFRRPKFVAGNGLGVYGKQKTSVQNDYYYEALANGEDVFDEGWEKPRFARVMSEEEYNEAFNNRLAELIAEPTQKNRTLVVGKPSAFLIDGGVYNNQIVLDFDKLVRKAREDYKNEHPFELEDVMNLPNAISHPIAVFENTNNNSANEFVILTEIQNNGKNFIVALKAVERRVSGGRVIEVNNIQTLFPKNARGIVKWFIDDKATNIDKEKALNWLEALRTHRGTELTSQELDSAANLVNSFDMPKYKGENRRNTTDFEHSEGEMDAMESAVKEVADTLNVPVKVVRSESDVDALEGLSTANKEILKRDGKGYYNTKSGEVVIYLANNEDAEDACASVLHEIVGHKGLRQLVGEKEYNRFLAKVYADMPRAEREELNRRAEKEFGWDIYEALDETLAEMAEKDETPSWWNRVVSAFREMLRKLGMNIKLSGNDLKYILWQSKNQLKRGDIVGEAESRVMRDKLGINTNRATSRTAQGRNGGSIENSTKTAKKADAESESGVRFRKVEDEELIDWFDKQPKVVTYKTVAMGNDGEMHAPMADNVSGTKGLKDKVKTGNYTFGDVLEAEEHPELADEKGKIKIQREDGKTLDVAYDPYDHSSDSMINDQFKSAWERDNLVVIRQEIPLSEVEGENRYHAEKALLPVGRHNWKKGVVGNKLNDADSRHVYLSRWSRPLERVDWQEVADEWIEKCMRNGIDVPFNVVPRAIRDIIADAGVNIIAPEKGMGQNCFDAYEEWKNGRNPNGGGRNTTSKKGLDRNGRIEDANELARLFDNNGETLDTSDVIISHERISQAYNHFADQFGREHAIVIDSNTTIDDLIKQGFNRYDAENAIESINNSDFIGEYFSDSEKIAIFDRGNDVPLSEIEKTFFHENMHAVLEEVYGDNSHERTLCETFWRAAEGYFPKADKYSDMYVENRRPEEHFCYVMEDCMSEGTLDLAELFMDEKMFEDFNKILNTFGYDRRRQAARRSNPQARSRYFDPTGQGQTQSNGRKNSGQNESGRMRMGSSEGHKGQGRIAEVVGSLDDGTDVVAKESGVAKDMYERTLQQGMYKFQEAWQDSMLGLKEAMNAVMAAEGKTFEDVADWENAYMAENLMSSINDKEFKVYRRVAFQPILLAFKKLEDMKASKDKINEYLVAKHGLERNDYMTKARVNEKLDAEFGEEIEIANKQLDEDLISFDEWEAIMDDIKMRKEDMEIELLGSERRDFSGLTALTNHTVEDDIFEIEEDARKIVDDFEEYYDTTELWEAINRATQAQLDKQLESGMMSREVYEDLKNRYQYYIPLRGFDETTSDEVYDYLQHSQSPMNEPIKKANGRKSLADDPIATIGNMAESGIMAANRNLMKQKMLNFVENHRSDLFSVSDVHLMKREGIGGEEEWVAIGPAYLKETGIEKIEPTQAEFESWFAKKMEEEPDSYAMGKDKPNIKYRTLKKFMGEHQIVVKRAGKQYVITVNGDPRAAQAINGLTNPDSVKNITKALVSLTNIMARLNTTFSPSFVVANLSRDGIYANSMVWAKESPAYAIKFNKNWSKSMMVTGKLVMKFNNGTLDMSKPIEKMFHEFMMNGGETGQTRLTNVEQYKGVMQDALDDMRRKKWNPKNMLMMTGSALEIMNQWAEDTTRFAAFMTSREMGRSVMRSAYDAKEISVNFNKKGAGASTAGKWEKGNRMHYINNQMAQLLRPWFMFFNAGVQGMYNTGKIAARHKGKFTAIAFGYLGLGMLAPFIAAACGGDGDDDYWNLPEYVRRQNLCLYVGSGYVKIPLPIELRAIYGLGDIIAGQMLEKTRYNGSELAVQVGEQFGQVLPIDVVGEGGMSLVPSVLKPPFEAYITNKDWTGLPIYKEGEYLKNAPNWMKAYSKTDPTVVSFCEWMNEVSGGNQYKKGGIDLNPARLEHLYNGYLGGMGTFFSQTKRTMGQLFGDEELNVRNVPVANRFYAHADERMAIKRIDNEYYRNKEKIEKFEYELNGFKKEMKSPDLTIAAEAQDRYMKLVQSEENVKYEIWKSYNKNIEALKTALKESGDVEIEKTIYEIKDLLNKEMSR